MAAQHNLRDTIKGDTFDKVDFTLEKNGSPIDISTATIKIAFRYLRKEGKIAKVLTVGEGITITNAIQGKFRIDAFVANLSPGVYYYDIELTIGTTVKTYVEGTLTILQDVS